MKFTIIVIAAVTSSMLTGTILTSIQPYASGVSSPSLRDSISQEMSTDLNNTSQSINQDNLCLKSNDCRQSSVAQNTRGNNNQITGFADQSDNLQQTTTPTSPTSPTSTPTPIPAACPADTIFAATVIQEGPIENSPVGTVFCLRSTGINLNVVVILPTGVRGTGNVVVASPNPDTGQCPLLKVALSPILIQTTAAIVTSGVSPIGTTVCVGFI